MPFLTYITLSFLLIFFSFDTQAQASSASWKSVVIKDTKHLHQQEKLRLDDFNVITLQYDSYQNTFPTITTPIPSNSIATNQINSEVTQYIIQKTQLVSTQDKRYSIHLNGKFDKKTIPTNIVAWVDAATFDQQPIALSQLPDGQYLGIFDIHITSYWQ